MGFEAELTQSTTLVYVLLSLEPSYQMMLGSLISWSSKGLRLRLSLWLCYASITLELGIQVTLLEPKGGFEENFCPNYP